MNVGDLVIIREDITKLDLLNRKNRDTIYYLKKGDLGIILAVREYSKESRCRVLIEGGIWGLSQDILESVSC